MGTVARAEVFERERCLPFVHVNRRPPRAYGFVAYVRRSDGASSIQPLFPQMNPASGVADMINLPLEVRRTGRFGRPGYDTVLIEHTHPLPYSFGNQIGRGYVRGPSEPDFSLLGRNGKAIGVVQALDPTGGRQFFYYGPRVYPNG